MKTSKSKGIKEKIIKHLDQRISYLKKYRIKTNDYSNGFSSNESGPCCDKCGMDKKAVVKSGRAVAFRLLVGCLDPFQIKCKCHIPYRKVATEAELGLLKELKWYFKDKPLTDNKE